MGSTTNRQIPYIEPGDTLAAYPAADKAQAERLDTLLFDTGWVDVTVNAGFVATSTTDRPRVRRIGSVVYIKGAWGATGITANATPVVGQLPAGFFPTSNIGMRSGTNSGAATASVIINSTGTVQLRTGATTGTYYYVNTSWTID